MIPNKFKKLALSMMITIFSIPLTSLAMAQDNKDLMEKGMWKDPDTGLVWMRCSIGQEWKDGTCTGQAISMNMHDVAKYFDLFNEQVAFGGNNDWRVPTVKELASLRSCTEGWMRENTVTVGNLSKTTGAILQKNIHGDSSSIPKKCAIGSKRPTINMQIFPNTPSEGFWTNSSAGYFSSMFERLQAYHYVDFSKGEFSREGINYLYFLRGVREDSK